MVVVQLLLQVSRRMVSAATPAAAAASAGTGFGAVNDGIAEE